MSASQATKHPVVFVHGLWLHAESWKNWIDFFREHGYEAVAASWPGDSETTEATRRKSNAIAGHGVTEIADHIADQIKILQQKPIMIGWFGVPASYGTRRAEWLRKAAQALQQPQVKAVVYDDVAKDAVDGDSVAASALRELATSPFFNPRNLPVQSG